MVESCALSTGRVNSFRLSAVELAPPSRLELEEESSFSDLKEDESISKTTVVEFF
jgi:hypothetical protein